MPSQTFYPNLQISLHEYLRHIRDISQLWPDVIWAALVLARSNNINNTPKYTPDSVTRLVGIRHRTLSVQDFLVAKRMDFLKYPLDLQNLI